MKGHMQVDAASERKAFREDVAVLEDGTYDAVIVDADETEVGSGGLHVELTIVAGPDVGQVVSVRGRFEVVDPIELLGLPATIVVADGRPDVTVEA